MQETQSRLTEEFSAVARYYCDITWGKALVPLGSLLILASDDLGAYIMIPISRSSQVLTLLPQSNQPQYLKFLQQIKPFLLLWKSQ